MSEHRIPAAGDPFLSRSDWRKLADAEPCPHCLDTGWVTMTCEDEDGEPEDYSVLCRRCSEAGGAS